MVTMRLTAVGLCGSGPESLVTGLGDGERDETEAEDSEKLHLDDFVTRVLRCFA